MKISAIQPRVLPNIVKSATKTLPQEIKLATAAGIATLTGAVTSKTLAPGDGEGCGSTESTCSPLLTF